jgi:hypothetical protein
MSARRSFGTTAIRRRTMTEQPLRRDGFIWEVRRTLDEYRRMLQRGRSRKDFNK